MHAFFDVLSVFLTDPVLPKLRRMFKHIKQTYKHFINTILTFRWFGGCVYWLFVSGDA
tara:strand:+ start:1029 stop:1202 length:174 start_codon:yes stop_codon:yes gene_type:complete